LKEQHIQALQDILIKSNLHENLMLLERALFNNNHCTFLSCETKIYAIRDEDTITVHTEILDLIPKNMMLITCQSKSSTHVSIWHNQLASLNKDTLILKDVMIPISHLKNESIANKDLRFLKSEEILTPASFNAWPKLISFSIISKPRAMNFKLFSFLKTSSWSSKEREFQNSTQLVT
jgi:hypothetical protein